MTMSPTMNPPEFGLAEYNVTNPRVRVYHAKFSKPQIRQGRTFRKTMRNILKETSNYLRVATQYFASQKGFIFRGVPHDNSEVSTTNDKNKNKMPIPPKADFQTARVNCKSEIGDPRKAEIH